MQSRVMFITLELLSFRQVVRTSGTCGVVSGEFVVSVSVIVSVEGW
jgi:hypothetical protein